MKPENSMSVEFPSRSANEALARAVVACFAAQLDPTLDELGDIKTAVSEAVTNCIVHAYRDTIGPITVRCRVLDAQGKMHNHYPITGLDDGLVSLHGFLWAWRTGVLRHSPVILEIRENHGAPSTWLRLRALLNGEETGA